jgi:hypothetical protein
VVSEHEFAEMSLAEFADWLSTSWVSVRAVTRGTRWNVILVVHIDQGAQEYFGRGQSFFSALADAENERASKGESWVQS